MIFPIVQRSTLRRRHHAQRGNRRGGERIEERIWPAEPAQPPAEQFRQAAGDEPERARRRRIRLQRRGRGIFEDAAKWRTEHLIAGSAIRLVVHEAVDEADNGKTRTGRVAHRGSATVGVPPEDPAGELQATHGIRACGQLHAPGRHVEDIRSTRGIEHVRPIEETRKGPAIAAVADEAKAPVRRNAVCNATHMAAPAAKRDVS
jgi:hypothetical protein